MKGAIWNRKEKYSHEAMNQLQAENDLFAAKLVGVVSEQLNQFGCSNFKHATFKQPLANVNNNELAGGAMV